MEPGDGGGIVQLLDLVEEHGAALERDLIRDGLRLRHCPSADFTWRDLLVYVRYADDTSALWQSRNPKYRGWTLEARLLAIIANALRWLVWSKTKDGQRNRHKPIPIGPDMGAQAARPGLKVKAGPLSKVKKMLGLDKGDDGGRRERKLHRIFRR